MSRTSLIIDCDPGVDDAIALFLAFAAPERLHILGITTVAGNVSAALTARNARILRQIAGREDVPVIAGCTRPMVRAPVEAGHFHGESGLGDLDVFEPTAPMEPGHAVDFIIRTVMEQPVGCVSLAVTGPMTNLAMAIVREPAIIERLGPVVAMGGARSGGGNITASAEYNIYADPHAAQVVAGSGCALVMMGLDVTHQVRATPQRIARLEGLGTDTAKASVDLLRFCARMERTHGGGGDPPQHDPCTIAYLLDPGLFVTVPCHLEIETASPLTQGHTAVEFRLRDRPTSVRWATWADADGVFDLLADHLGRGPVRDA